MSAFIKRKPLTADAAKSRAEALCAKAEHCRGEIRKKLLGWGIFPVEAERILDALEADRYIDDQRFARAFTRSKVLFNRWGRRKIAFALWQKGVSKADIAYGAEQVEEEEYLEALRAVVAAKRRSTADADTYEGRTKIFRHALQRGFESDLIAAELRRKATNTDQ
ncbi:MAG: RecX family transcriptional regulator [Muribaculaceae bacterium]|nr:RecX family transcriptional regulator [Muribaculaceae bacterium]